MVRHIKHTHTHTYTHTHTHTHTHTQVRVVIPKKEREVLEQITWKLDKLENDTLPQVDLNAKEVGGLGLGYR